MLLLMDLLSHPVNQNSKKISSDEIAQKFWVRYLFQGQSIFKIRIGYKEKQNIEENFIFSFGQILSH